MIVRRRFTAYGVNELQNNPLYINTFDPLAEGLKFHYIVHTALDVIEEKRMSLRELVTILMSSA